MYNYFAFLSPSLDLTIKKTMYISLDRINFQRFIMQSL